MLEEGLPIASGVQASPANGVSEGKKVLARPRICTLSALCMYMYMYMYSVCVLCVVACVAQGLVGA